MYNLSSAYPSDKRAYCDHYSHLEIIAHKIQFLQAFFAFLRVILKFAPFSQDFPRKKARLYTVNRVFIIYYVTMRQHSLASLYHPNGITIIQFDRKTVGIIFLLPRRIVHHTKQILGRNSAKLILRMHNRE